MKTFSLDNMFSASLAVALVLACTVSHAQAATDSVAFPAVVIQASASTASRAEVRADLAVWNAAGMDKYSVEDGVDYYSAKYKQDYATYTALRSSPQFAVLVGDFERGQTPTVVVERSPLRVSVATR